MRIALIGCMVMNREISHLIAESPHIIRPWWLRQGLHDTPDILRAELQKIIDEIEAENETYRAYQRFDAIVLGYGLCSNGVIGLESRTIPIVVPRCDDCISLFVGSAERYRQLFDEMPGAYWYNSGWIEQAFTPSKEHYEQQRAEYAELYGEEEADYLMECTNGWMRNYKHCGFITCPLGDQPGYEDYTRCAARHFGWEFRKIEGSMDYFNAMLAGDWQDDKFLICPPAHRIAPDYEGARKFKSEAI